MNTETRVTQVQHFPTRGEIKNKASNKLLTLLDNSNDNDKKAYTNIKQPNNEGGSHYAVAAGRSTGVFEDWAEAQAAMSGYKHSSFKQNKNI